MTQAPPPGIDAEELREIALRATPGPWYTAGPPWFQTGSGVLAGSPDPHVGYMIVDTEPWDGDREEYAENGGSVKLADPDADAEFIATFDPPTVLALLDRLDAPDVGGELADRAIGESLFDAMVSASETLTSEKWTDLDPDTRARFARAGQRFLKSQNREAAIRGRGVGEKEEVLPGPRPDDLCGDASSGAATIAELRAKLCAAQEEAEDARTTLAAWFDLAARIEADAAPIVLAGLRGYLRTAKNGGMPTKTADAVEAVVSDYCRLYLGKDLVPVLRSLSGGAERVHEGKPRDDLNSTSIPSSGDALKEALEAAARGRRAILELARVRGVLEEGLQKTAILRTESVYVWASMAREFIATAKRLEEEDLAVLSTPLEQPLPDDGGRT